MNSEAQEQLRAAGRLEAESSARSLAAAERAIDEGRLNIAKVMRASALASRQRALALARITDHGDPASKAVTLAASVARNTASTLEQHTGDREDIASVLRSALSAEAILGKTEESIVDDSDVPERVVAQFVWICEECGYAIEGSREEICPSCGSIAGEFALFAPFFSGTSEHIARRKPEDALLQLQGDADRLAQALVGADERLRARAAPGEWCAKEIAGHMCDILELAERRLRVLVDPEYTPPSERTVLPWKLLDTEDYPNIAATGIVERFRSGSDALCGLLVVLKEEDWRRKVDMVSGRTIVIDVASWAANHNVAHLAQIRTLLQLTDL